MTWMVYHTDAEKVAGLADIIIDEALNRPIQVVKDMPNLRLTKVFSDAAVTWGDAASQ